MEMGNSFFVDCFNFCCVIFFAMIYIEIDFDLIL